jgi:riboflavin synthase
VGGVGDSNWWLKVRVPKSLDRDLVEKGSVTLDGISLTLAAMDGDVVGVTIIPHTFANTTLGQAHVGTRLNIEVDVLAKHVEKLLAHR